MKEKPNSSSVLYLSCAHAYEKYLDELERLGVSPECLMAMIKDPFTIPEEACDGPSDYNSVRKGLAVVQDIVKKWEERERSSFRTVVRGSLEARIKQSQKAISSAEKNRADLAVVPKSRATRPNKDSPGKYYYSTQPFLAYYINHFFYGGIHFAYVGGKFYPYRKPNPKSSNPLLVYQDLYQPWRDADDFDKFITGMRLNLRKGVIAKSKKLNPYLRKRLKRVCAKVSIELLYPIVYRVDITQIPKGRRLQDASASVGSDEYKIVDLKENEFDVLFDDFVVEPILSKFLIHGKSGSRFRPLALKILEARLKP